MSPHLKETTLLAANTKLASAFNVVLAHLPLHAEESTLRSTLPEGVLVSALRKTGIGDESATMLVSILRQQLNALALLDRVDLVRDKWTFVSFPAALLGRSLIETLAVPEQAILPSDYWEQGDHRPQATKEEQRRLLHRVESERLRLNPDARPVRVVNVAWAVIRLGDKFLLHRREDLDRPGEKTHVLPGGRFTPNDLPAEILKSTPDVLRQIFDVDSRLVDSHLDTTLVRELNEELGLINGQDYSFERWQRLPSYRQVGGAGNRHAYSEYGFQLYTVRLTPLGEVRLLNREAESSALTWFSAEELAAPLRADGASAYIDAIHSAWGKDVVRQLASVADSSASIFALAGESNTLDLPGTPSSGFQRGKPGKEDLLPLKLSDDEWKLLLLLGWHARGLMVESLVNAVLLGGGWVRLAESAACSLGFRLLDLVNNVLPGLIEIRERRYLRLSIEPQWLMVGTELIGYRIDGNDTAGGYLTVARQSVPTTWGTLMGGSVRKPINGNTVRILRELERGDGPDDLPGVKAKSWERNLREQLADLRQLGLRRFWTTRNGTSSLAEGLHRLPANMGLL